MNTKGKARGADVSPEPQTSLGLLPPVGMGMGKGNTRSLGPSKTRQDKVLKDYKNPTGNGSHFGH